ncbi:DUF4349 domain-containing protein [Paenibacillus spongiae]|uniref:DUF4349 domain-containing protein n=1 Tax=Paenibacillus spongiae TaxID=2909671 RepID=A0ABY5SHM2_9BACL|nr:DUF4349 domain-containing protein [Paenibacillus spongiae]UVI32185.1 DUF4349 domain-containing protein [Paenibacillus spongiae]
MIKWARKWNSGWTRMYALLLMAIILVGLAGCSSANEDSGDSALQSIEGTMKSMKSDSSSGQDKAELANTEADQASESVKSSTEAPAQEAGAGFGSGMQSGSAADSDGFNRKLIYRANVTMEVEDYAKSQTSLRNAIHLSGGYMLQFTDQKSSGEQGGTYTIKIPAEGFMSFLTELEKIKHLFYETSMQGTDVTEEYVDLESRLKARQVVEARLLAFMDKATKADDLLQFSAQLGEVQLEIERIKGRMRYLDQNVSYSTVELRMYERIEQAAKMEEEKPVFMKRLTNALTGSTTVLYEFAQGLLIVLAGALPVVVVLAVIAIPVYVAYRRRESLRLAARRRHTQKSAAAGEPQNSAPDAAENQEEEL